MKEDEIVEGKTELYVLISSSLMAMLLKREKEWNEETPFDEIVEDLLIRGFAFDKVEVEISLLMSKIEGKVLAELGLEADGVTKLAEKGL